MTERDILIVDDERDIRALIAGILGDEGYATREADGVEAARAAIAAKVPDVLILDIWLKDNAQDGMSLLAEIQPAHPDLPIIMISGHGTIEMAVQAIRQGAYDFIEKPFKTERLLLMLARALETRKLRQENAALRKAVTPRIVDLVGESQSMQQIKGLVAKVAATSGRVLLTGEAGIGKESVARLIHTQSPRSSAPFVTLNCATELPDAQEAALFGTSDSAGLLEQAAGGTLYLDEITEMPTAVQMRLLRFLQDGLVQPVGSSAAGAPVDVRVIAASSQDVDLAVRDGRMKPDLYYRLNVVPLRIPPLRERLADIPYLLAEFLSPHLSQKLHGDTLLATDALAALQAYAWPGNIRELRNMAEWIAIMHGKSVRLPLSARELPPAISGQGGAGEDGAAGRTGIAPALLSLPLREAREQFELDYLGAQLRRFEGNVSQTAKHIGMERSALHRKMKLLQGGDE